jgi:hypothetical protein
VLLGDDDWGNSTCFHFQDVDPNAKTEIQVTTCSNEFVIALQLLRHDFIEGLNSCSNVVARAAIEEWAEKQLSAKVEYCTAAGLKSRKAVRGWERFVMRSLSRGRGSNKKTALGWGFVGFEGSIKVPVGLHLASFF